MGLKRLSFLIVLSIILIIVFYFLKKIEIYYHGLHFTLKSVTKPMELIFRMVHPLISACCWKVWEKIKPAWT